MKLDIKRFFSARAIIWLIVLILIAPWKDAFRTIKGINFPLLYILSLLGLALLVVINYMRTIKPELKSSVLEFIYALEFTVVILLTLSIKLVIVTEPLIFVPIISRAMTSKDLTLTWLYTLSYFTIVAIASALNPIEGVSRLFSISFSIASGLCTSLLPIIIITLKKLIKAKLEGEISANYRKKIEEAHRVSREKALQLEKAMEDVRGLLEQQNAMLNLIRLMASHQSNVNEVLMVAAEKAKEVGQVDGVAIMLEKAGLLIPEIAINLPEPIKMRLTTDQNKGLLGKAFRERQVIIATSKDYPDYFKSIETLQYTVRDMAIFPLIGGTKRIIGLLVLINKLFEYNEQKIQFLTTLGVQGGIILENALLQNKLKNAFYETIISFSSAIEAKDKYTHVMHTKRVADLAAEIARELGFPEEEVERIWIGGLLHDVGKLAIPDTILAKQGPLTEEEREIIKRHPEEGAKILSKISLFREMDIIPLVLYHHERYDGKGYPKGLKGNKIPIEANIISIADTYDAIATPRPYNRQYASHERAVEIIKRERGKQFYPQVVDAFLKVISRKRPVISRRSSPLRHQRYS